MWDSVVIGSGEKSCSALLVRDMEGGGSISENKHAYWISRLILGLGMTVYKTTEEGVTIKEMLETAASDSVISQYLNNALIRCISSQALISAIEQAQKTAFIAGRADKAVEIQRALGL